MSLCEYPIIYWLNVWPSFGQFEACSSMKSTGTNTRTAKPVGSHFSQSWNHYNSVHMKTLQSELCIVHSTAQITKTSMHVYIFLTCHSYNSCRYCETLYQCVYSFSLLHV